MIQRNTTLNGSVVEPSVRYAEFVSPLRDGLSLSVGGQGSIVRAVVRLRFSGGPLAVFRRVRQGCVAALNRHSRRAWPHRQCKRLERPKPLRADSHAISAVGRVADMARISASGDHVLPRLALSGHRSPGKRVLRSGTDRDPVLSSALDLPASAARCVATDEVRGLHGLRFSTVAHTGPDGATLGRVLAPCRDEQAPESLSSQIMHSSAFVAFASHGANFNRSQTK